MAEHSVADARNNLSALIGKALEGEQVIITRHGQPVVELRPVGRKGRRMTPADVEWLESVRVKPLIPDKDPKNIIERMRDEEVERLFRR
jgi:prevent-host-death family protein